MVVHFLPTLGEEILLVLSSQRVPDTISSYNHKALKTAFYVFFFIFFLPSFVLFIFSPLPSVRDDCRGKVLKLCPLQRLSKPVTIDFYDFHPKSHSVVQSFWTTLKYELSRRKYLLFLIDTIRDYMLQWLVHGREWSCQIVNNGFSPPFAVGLLIPVVLWIILRQSTLHDVTVVFSLQVGNHGGRRPKHRQNHRTASWRYAL